MKKLGIKTIVFSVFLVTVSHLYAQHQISGRIMQENKTDTPVEFANIVLTTADSAYVTGMSGDLNGYFQFKNIPSGDYLVTTSYLGFSPKAIALNNLSKSIDLGDIYMEEKTTQLATVTVTASNTINKTDRTIIFVTNQQRANSSNGINLLTTMQFPRLTVNPITNDVSLPGEEQVQFRINGVKVERTDVRALQPNDILRIEYLDNPGLRYGDVGAVINYILKREQTGGSISLDLGNSVTTGFADDQISAKVNHKKSEFGLNYSFRYRKPTEMWADEKRIFNFSDGSSMVRLSDGSAADFKEEYHKINLNYNLSDNKNYFNVMLRQSILNDDKIRYSSQYILTNPTDITQVEQGSKGHQYLPSIDLYYSRSLKNNQTVILNMVGTSINSDFDQKYEAVKEEQIISDIISNVEGKKYSIISEGIYEKIFKNSNRLTAGLKYTRAFADNNYTGTEFGQTRMNQSETYIYTEVAGKKNKFGYTGGIGLSCSWAQQEGEDEYSFYTFRPKLTLQYDFTRSMFLRLKGEVFNTSPSLSNLSAVDQYIDTLQIMRGNPLLKPNLNYLANLQFNWKKGLYGMSLYSTYTYSPDPIMEEIIRENDKFIRTYNNHKNWQKLNNEVTLSAGPIKDIVMASLTGGVNYYISNGNTYSHTHTNFYYRVQVMAMYKKFSGIFQISSANDQFSGETLNGGENMHLFMLSYNGGKFTIGAGFLSPFSDQYKRYSESRNSYTPYQSYAYANDFSRMILLKFAWNFNYGRKVKSSNKRITNEDMDSGIMRTGN